MPVLPTSTPLRHSIALSVLVLTWVACGPADEREAPPARRQPTREAVDDRWNQSPEWIDIYTPDRASPGYNLILYNRRVPLLMDMNGAIVHAWPEVRASGRARLLPTGHLAVISEIGTLMEFDWDGELVWSYSLADPDTFLHHDFVLLDNGHYLLLAHDPSVASDFLLEVDRAGATVWRWNSNEALQDEFARAGPRNNKTHINSVQELPDNRWFERGHDAFRPGNILVSARNLNALYIVDRHQGTVAWRYYDGLDYQHEAQMIPPGQNGAGNILVFNNGYHNRYAFRQSALIEINPVERSVVWEFRSPGFFSSTGGTEQSLINGNLLVTSSQGGRVFELGRDGRIVWQWSPPYLPMRASRYPNDFSAPTKKLGRPSTEAIDRRDPTRFVDADLFSFSLPHETRRVKDGSRTRMILRDQNRCQVLQLPAQTRIVLGYGHWREGSDTPFISSQARFVASLRDVDSDRSEVLLDRTLGGDPDDPLQDGSKLRLMEETIELGNDSRRAVELCLSLSSSSGGPPSEEFVWEDPTIRAPSRWAQFELDSEADPEALEQQEKHLKAIGYIN